MHIKLYVMIKMLGKEAKKTLNDDDNGANKSLDEAKRMVGRSVSLVKFYELSIESFWLLIHYSYSGDFMPFGSISFG